MLVRGFCSALALATAVSVVLGAASTPSSARSEVQLELGGLLIEDERYWEAIPVFSRAKEGATEEQLERASSGLLRALLAVAEFNRAYEETQVLGGLGPLGSESRALYADGLWAYGLFEEAETTYREILAEEPSSPGARHGLARSLAAQSQFEAALDELDVALAGAPDTAEFYHTAGSIYRRMKRYEDAANAFEGVRRAAAELPPCRQGGVGELTGALPAFVRRSGPPRDSRRRGYRASRAVPAQR